MVPEILKIDVPDALRLQAPANYSTMAQQLPQVFAKHEQNRNEMLISLS